VLWGVCGWGVWWYCIGGGWLFNSGHIPRLSCGVMAWKMFILLVLMCCLYS